MGIKGMRNYRLYILIALFTFVVGIAITGFLLSRRQQSSEAVYLVQLAPSPDQMPLQFSWWYESRELGGHSDGYIASDGAKIARDCIGYSSVARTQRMFTSKLKDAIQIIERTPVLDEKGGRIGERVVALFTSKD